MSELLDNPVDTQGENLKINFRGSHKPSYSGCDENKEKNDCRIKNFVMKGGLYKAVSEYCSELALTKW